MFAICMSSIDPVKYQDNGIDPIKICCFYISFYFYCAEFDTAANHVDLLRCSNGVYANGTV